MRTTGSTHRACALCGDVAMLRWLPNPTTKTPYLYLKPLQRRYLQKIGEKIAEKRMPHVTYAAHAHKTGQEVASICTGYRSPKFCYYKLNRFGKIAIYVVRKKEGKKKKRKKKRKNSDENKMSSNYRWKT